MGTLDGTNSTGDIRIMVLGAKGVGKSAITVRFLTKRYIGEYDSEKDQCYSTVCNIGSNRTMPVEIIDYASQETQNPTIPSNHELQNAAGIVIVYSITDPASFVHASTLLNHIHQSCTCPPTSLLLLANKTDLKQQSRVPRDEGSRLAAERSCLFEEVSAAEHFVPVHKAFNGLLREIGGRFKSSLGRKRRPTFLNVSKALVAMMRMKGKSQTGDGDGGDVEEGDTVEDL